MIKPHQCRQSPGNLMPRDPFMSIGEATGLGRVFDYNIVRQAKLVSKLLRQPSVRAAESS